MIAHYSSTPEFEFSVIRTHRYREEYMVSIRWRKTNRRFEMDDLSKENAFGIVRNLSEGKYPF